MAATTKRHLVLKLERDFTSRIPPVTISWRWSNTNTWASDQHHLDINTTTIEYLNTLQNKTFGDTPVSELMTHKKWGLWQFLPSYFFSPLRLVFEIIDRVQLIVSSTGAQSIHLLPTAPQDQYIWHTVISAFCKSNSIRLDDTAIPLQPARLIHYLKEWGLRRPSFFQERYKQKMAGVKLGSAFLEKPTTPGGIAFISSTTYWIQNPLGGYYDEQMTPIAKELQAMGEKNLIGIDTPYYTHGWKSIEVLKHKIETDDIINWTTFDAFESNTLQTEIKSAKKRFRKQWKYLKKHTDYRNLFRYNNVELWPILLPYLRDIFLKTLPEIVREIETAGALLNHLRPKAIVLTYEHGPYQRALILEAAKRGIPSIGLHHGAVGKNCSDSMHAHVTANPLEHPNGFAVPTVTCVYGQHYKEILTQQGHYSTESVEVTGHWRYDHHLQSIDISALQKSLDIDPQAKTVLVITAGLNTCQHLEDCLSILGNCPEYNIVVKLHPRESHTAPLALIRQLNKTNCRVIEDRLQDLLKVADLVIVEDACTTPIEAALFDKPVITTNYDFREWDIGYSNSGIYVKVHNQEEMRQAIHRLFHDHNLLQDMAALRPEFILKHMHKKDGQAANRVTKKILELCNSRQSNHSPITT